MKILILAEETLCHLYSRWCRGKESACQCRRCKRGGFDPCIRKIPWRRAWQPSPVFLPGKSHRQKSLAGYSPGGQKSQDTNEQLSIAQQRQIIEGEIEVYTYAETQGGKMCSKCTEPRKTLWIHWLQGLLNTVGIQIAFNYKNHFRKIQLRTNGIFKGNMCMHTGFIGLIF